jgi:hypothetical protein
VIQKLAFGPKRKLSRLIDRKGVNMNHIDPFAIYQSRGFGSVEIPIFESRMVYKEANLKKEENRESIHPISITISNDDGS